MRWESKVKYAELAPAHNWRFKDSGNFGGHSLLTPDSNTLSHHGVPGMHWGITTKEYVKKGYNTIARRQAILKQKRKAEAKVQFEEGYKRGQRVASNTNFVKNSANKVLARKESSQEKESFSDKVVSKVTDYALKKSRLDQTAKQYGLDHHLPKVKDFLKSKKDDRISDLYEHLQTKEGQERLQKFADFMAKGIYSVLKNGPDVKRLVNEGGRALRKAVATGAGRAVRTASSSVKEGYKWLREGNPRGTEKIHNIVRSAELHAQQKLADLLNQKRRRA